MFSDLCQDKDKLKLQSTKILLVHPTYEIIFGHCPIVHFSIIIPIFLSLFQHCDSKSFCNVFVQWFMVSYLYCSTQLSLRATTFEREIKKISKELFFNVDGDCWKKVFYKSLTILNEYKIFNTMFSHLSYISIIKNMNFNIRNLHSFIILNFRSEYVNMTVV